MAATASCSFPAEGFHEHQADPSQWEAGGYCENGDSAFEGSDWAGWEGMAHGSTHATYGDDAVGNSAGYVDDWGVWIPPSVMACHDTCNTGGYESSGRTVASHGATGEPYGNAGGANSTGYIDDWGAWIPPLVTARRDRKCTGDYDETGLFVPRDLDAELRVRLAKLGLGPTSAAEKDEERKKQDVELKHRGDELKRRMATIVAKAKIKMSMDRAAEAAAAAETVLAEAAAETVSQLSTEETGSEHRPRFDSSGPEEEEGSDDNVTGWFSGGPSWNDVAPGFV